MNATNKLKVVAFFAGDVLALYASLFITLIIRSGSHFYQQFLATHAFPFTILFILWLIVFYIAGLYDLRHLRNNYDFLRTLSVGLSINAVIAILLFYFVPVFGIAPKTSLFIFIAVFAVIEVIARRVFNNIISSSDAPNKILMIGDGESAKEVVETIKNTPQLGYAVKVWIPDADTARISQLKTIVKDHSINMIVVPRHLRQDSRIANSLYEMLSSGIEIHDLTNFYEVVMGKIPLADLQEAWFLENLLAKNPLYEFSKRVTDIIAGIILGIIAIPLFPIMAILIKFSSPGAIIIKQVRVRKNGELYNHYKFRTMRETKNANAWLDKDEDRITTVGKFLRRTHLDELPQVVNLLRGELSLVGPRPDFIDFYNKLKEQIPYYTIRTISKPGLTGWAQVNFPTTVSLEENKERLCYDIYYLKNRSLVLDVLIGLKTVKAVFTASGK